MISFRRTALLTAMLTAATFATFGCRNSKSQGSQPAAPAASSRTENPVWLGRQPNDEVGLLLRDLDSGDPLRTWHAEESLGAMGPAVAARTRAAMNASTPEARAAACRLAYQFRDASALSGMIALLGDDSRLVRNTANVFLCGLTDQDFGFRADAMPADRAAAQDLWEAWYAKTHGPVLAPKRK
jgi:hypothetical protein